MPPVEILEQYQALTTQAGLVALGNRTQIELRGADRASFLHNLCTNEIRKLPIGGCCEAFLTNVQGKALAFGHIWAAPESLVFSTVAGMGEQLTAHLDRYLIREQVELIDRSQQWIELLLAGPRSDHMLQAASVASQLLSVCSVEMVQPRCLLLRTTSERSVEVSKRLIDAGAAIATAPALEMARVEAGFPWYGIDITPDNLAPEVGRNQQAISYVKGCYLGQETMARIDALGHVNRSLVGVSIEGSELPVPGSELTAAEKVVGHVTSGAYSPRLQANLALAYVRRGHNEPGMQLTSSTGTARVVALPIS